MNGSPSPECCLSYCAAVDVLEIVNAIAASISRLSPAPALSVTADSPLEMGDIPRRP